MDSSGDTPTKSIKRIRLIFNLALLAIIFEFEDPLFVSSFFYETFYCNYAYLYSHFFLFNRSRRSMDRSTPGWSRPDLSDGRSYARDGGMDGLLPLHDHGNGWVTERI